MMPDEVNAFYLQVGKERRADPMRGATSKVFGRKVMGRKGVGKLAPFGICARIEVVSSGGPIRRGKDAAGQDVDGFMTAHLVLDRSHILTDTDEPYFPAVGPLDGSLQPAPGTSLTLTGFAYRRVPQIDSLERQLAHRFGVASPNWRIDLLDNLKPGADPNRTRTVGAFQIEKMEDTEVVFAPGRPDSGFNHEGRFYEVTGWLAYANHPFKDELMAGVRIYCRGKIAAQTSIFNMKAGFTGEHDIRSYLIGELHADWLDEEEDLIQTDRRDILWSHDLGVAFEEWGQRLVKQIGKAARPSLKKKLWARFKEVSRLDHQIAKAFPLTAQQPIREKAQDLAKMFAQTIREGEVEDNEVDPVV